jgi:hypothetical protein
MLWLKIVLTLYTISMLIIVNGSLALCNDEKYCLYPINPKSIRSHFGFRLR